MSGEAAEQTRSTPERESTDHLEKAAEGISSAFRSVWLALLGAPMAAAESGGRLFHHLVQQGEKVESQGKVRLKTMGESAGRAAKSVSSTMGETFRGVGEKARSIAGRSEEAIDRIITDKLEAMGVPTREDMESLRQRVDEIAGRLESLRAERQGEGGTVKQSTRQ